MREVQTRGHLHGPSRCQGMGQQIPQPSRLSRKRSRLGSWRRILVRNQPHSLSGSSKWLKGRRIKTKPRSTSSRGYLILFTTHFSQPFVKYTKLKHSNYGFPCFVKKNYTSMRKRGDVYCRLDLYTAFGRELKLRSVFSTYL